MGISPSFLSLRFGTAVLKKLRSKHRKQSVGPVFLTYLLPGTWQFTALHPGSSNNVL